MRTALTVAVVLSWLVMVGLLVEKQGAPPPVPAAPATTDAGADRDEWFAVLRDGRRIGRAHRTTTRTESGVRYTEDLVLALAMLDVPQRVHTSLVAETGSAGALRSFRFALDSPA